MGAIRDRLQAVVYRFPALLARFGIVDRRKGEEAFDLAVPVMITGGLRTLLRVSDFFMVSLALGPAAVAALEFGMQYYFIAFGIALALTSGTLSVVSRAVGARDMGRANLAIKQSLWLALALALPMVATAWFWAEPLVAVLTDDPRTIALGAVYLRIIMLSVVFRFWGLIGARALAGAGDTRTPMYVRLVTLPTNVVLNALLIFGLGPFPRLGVAGAAWGTTIATALAAAIFAAVLLSGRFAVRFDPRGAQVDAEIGREIVRVGAPLAGTRLSQTFGRFPFLFVLAELGTGVVAAYAIGRRVMMLANMPSWGYSTAASTLVGQHIGAGDDEGADEYGWQTLRLALATQLLIAAVLILAARPIAILFDPGDVGLTVAFIRVFGVGVAGFSIGRVFRGGLRGAGDTRWPLYGALAGTYLVRLPIAMLALPVGTAVTVLGFTATLGAGLALPAVFAAILADLYTRALVNAVRFRSGRWKAVARASAVGAGRTAD